MAAPRYYSIADLARRWGKHKQFIQRLVDRGDLPHEVVAGRRLVPADRCPKTCPSRGAGGRPAAKKKAP